MKVVKHNTNISNVLVIGSGGAGLRAAIEAKQAGVEVIVVGKGKKKMCILYWLREELMPLLEM